MERIFVAWVPDLHREGGYSYVGVTRGGGKIIQETATEQEAKNIVSTLTIETQGQAGGYMVVYADELKKNITLKAYPSDVDKVKETGTTPQKLLDTAMAEHLRDSAS